MKLQTVYDCLIDFGLPALLIVVLAVLLVTGTDGEVKTLMAALVGWITKAGVSRKRTPPTAK